MAAADQTAGFATASRGSWNATARAGVAGAVRLGALPFPAMLYLMTVVVPIGFRIGPLYMTTLRLLLIVAIIPLMIRLLAGRYGRVIFTDILFVLYIFWAAIAIGIHNPEQVVQQVGSVGIEFLGGYVIGRAYIRTPEAFGALCRILVLIVLCTTPFAIYETMTGRSPLLGFLANLPFVNSLRDVNAGERMNLQRVQSVFAHPIHYGLFCSVAFSLCFVAMKDTFGRTRRLITSALIAGSGFLALSSGALIAFIMQFALIAWYTAFKDVRQRWWLLLGLLALCYVTVDLLSNRTPLEVFMSRATFSAHNAYWRSLIFEWGLANVIGSAEKGIPASPLIGIGLNDWIRPHFMGSGSMDNFWLVITVRYGLPGFLLLALGYILVIARIMRRNFDGDARLTLYRRAWVFTFLGLTFTLCTVHVWTNLYSFIFFMFAAGIWLITTEPESDGADTDGPRDGKGRGVPAVAPQGDPPPGRSAISPGGLPYSRFPVRPRAGSGQGRIR